ncbi:alpha-alpha-trehalose-phosphate synthase [UDP-forming] isoform X1 [Brachionus plicatilis]|uniref:Alpha-alpha-trehalose-phosphate synthase [UDP-forming] isoform X1 n=1 Tax=Brachionus plicatilis TaxID=10195 RepID=A0A3M7RGW0_BRAPC|nr:alpha-alpha-trehalose-phosphate synthase [UDP-forming] isoform X1 [Brachionus plicatilis]
MKRSLVVVSNRLPFVISTNENGDPVRKNSAGGLVTALAPLVIKNDGYWVGWAGNDLTENMQIPESDDPTAIAHGIKSSQIIPIYLSKETFDLYYNGVCNGTLWPLMHSLPTLAVFRGDQWSAYVAVNELFSNSTFEAVKKFDNLDEKSNLVWIQDYQLMVMPMMLRNLLDEAHITCKLAFFLHIPFPSWDIFRLNPWANEILLGLLGCDLIAFHTNTYASNFIECCFYILGARVDRKEMIIEYGNKTSVVRALPIGIPYDWFEKNARIAPKPFNFKEKVIFGVDRLDYTKGIIQRVRGYERFLEKYPDCREKVVFFQVAVPSRTDVEDYRNLKDELEREIGRISGRFATAEWTPIKYICNNISQFDLAGYYRDARIGLITPVRDGMNLVAKEYVACQIDDPGVLIISPFTGAGETMNEALLVNPLEQDLIADAIKTAYDMKYYERKLRMNALQTRERLFNLDTWLESFFDAVDMIDNFKKMKSLNVSDYESWLGPILKGYNLSIILDYDGTLVPLQTHPDLAVLPDDVKSLLEKLAECKHIDVTILSGRSMENLKRLIKIKNINLSGSHGMELCLANGLQEECEQAVIFRAKIPDLVKELRENVCEHGGWIEEKRYHVTFHWRDTNPSFKQLMIQKATEIVQKYGFQATRAHCAVEARPPIGWDKGRGVYNILEKLYGVTWADTYKAVFIGDDETDEDAMRALSGLGITFRVGKPHVKTAASHRLANPDAVKIFLEWAIGYVDRIKSTIQTPVTERRLQAIRRKN